MTTFATTQKPFKTISKMSGHRLMAEQSSRFASSHQGWQFAPSLSINLGLNTQKLVAISCPASCSKKPMSLRNSKINNPCLQGLPLQHLAHGPRRLFNRLVSRSLANNYCVETFRLTVRQLACSTSRPHYPAPTIRISTFELSGPCALVKACNFFASVCASSRSCCATTCCRSELA